LIVEVNAALSAPGAQAGLADLWTTVLDMDTRVLPNRVTYELFDRGRDREATQYLAAECYYRRQESRNGGENRRSQEQYVLRWPTSLDAETVVASFSRAFVRHDVETVDLVIGTDIGVDHFEATLPITLGDVLEAVGEGDDQPEQDGSTRQLVWIRMGARVFDLYADVAPGELTRQPVVGVFVQTLNAAHLQDLYSRTAARFLLPAWFGRAIETLKE